MEFSRPWVLSVSNTEEEKDAVGVGTVVAGGPSEEMDHFLTGAQEQT